MKQQTGIQQLGSVAKEHEPRRRLSVYEFCSGKVPLRPIHRIGLLLLGGIPLLGWAFFEAIAISSLTGASTVVVCLFLPLILFWSLLAWPMGRMVLTALTAPSQTDEDPPDFES